MSESKAHKQFGCFTVFLISLYDLHILFLIQPKTADTSFHHSLSALPHFSLGISKGYFCCSPLSWSCTASCWRSGVQFQQLASTQLRLMGNCRHFEENTSNRSLFLCLDDTHNLCSFSVHQLQLLVTIQLLDVATLHCKPLCSHPLFRSPDPASCWQHCFASGKMTHICCSSWAACHSALLHQ